MNRKSPHLPRVIAALAVVALAWLCAQAPASASPTVSPHYTWYTDSITMQAQQQDEWCWAASGATIAAYWNYSITQNNFCDLAKGFNTGYSCPDWQGTLGDVQNAFYQLGFSYTGDAVGTVSFSTLSAQVAANQPLETRIQWQSGGGHMHVIYGFDASAGTVSYGDPWPSDNRYNTMSYGYYQDNNSFFWTDTLTGIKG